MKSKISCVKLNKVIFLAQCYEHKGLLNCLVTKVQMPTDVSNL